MASALEKIQREHQDLAQVLRALEKIVAAYDNGGSARERELLARIIYYIQVFPDRMHHPKEENFLFPALRQRAPDLAPVLDQLVAEHAECEAKTGRVAEAVRALEGGNEAAVRFYSDREWEQLADTYDSSANGADLSRSIAH